ncbi:MAG: hypothetical protein GF390_01820, partial [Candidatus Pacebacteria bacterium]|nr:hypothetical protein [Candidatus Paceibacterota bacterium]
MQNSAQTASSSTSSANAPMTTNQSTPAHHPKPLSPSNQEQTQTAPSSQPPNQAGSALLTQNTVTNPQATNAVNQPLATHNQPAPAQSSYQSPTSGVQQPAASNQQPAVNNPDPAANLANTTEDTSLWNKFKIYFSLKFSWHKVVAIALTIQG